MNEVGKKKIRWFGIPKTYINDNKIESDFSRLHLNCHPLIKKNKYVFLTYYHRYSQLQSQSDRGKKGHHIFIQQTFIEGLVYCMHCNKP